MTPFLPDVDPDTDLVLDRVVDVDVGAVWAAWTTPELLLQWFAPAPAEMVACEVDLRPGGTFRAVMRTADGVHAETLGSYLYVAAPHRLIWTTALAPGFRPVPDPAAAFTAAIDLRPEGPGTRYRAHLLHTDRAGARDHVARGFHDGWSSALDQLVDVVRRTPTPTSPTS